MRKNKKVRPRPAIEKEAILAETCRRSYEILRLKRVKYIDNPYTFIDLRLFQRGSDADGEDTYYPTRKGIQIKEDQFQRLIGQWTLIPSLLFHPIIMKKSYPALEREEFDTAVFNAFKAVEIRVRTLSKLPADVVGIALVRRAFDSKTGLLTDMSVPVAEREGMAHLFAGAIGCYKNPTSHRDTTFTFSDTFEMLLIASHLLRTLDRKSGGTKAQ